MALPKSVYIRELGPREGFQTLSKTYPYQDKLKLIDALAETGVKEIETASMVRPDRVPQMADAEKVLENLNPISGVKYTALYLNPKGFERAKAFDKLNLDGWFNLAASETFLKRNNNTDLQSVYEKAPQWCELFKANGIENLRLLISTAFGCTFEGNIPASRIIKILEQMIKSIGEQSTKLKEICLADTTGLASPEMLKERVEAVRDKFPSVEISLHLHDTRGTGMANVYAGLQEGVSTFDCSVAGLGGCPYAKGAAGNVATEDVAYMCEELGISTGLDLKKYVDAAKLAETIIGEPLPGKLYKVWSL